MLCSGLCASVGADLCMCAFTPIHTFHVGHGVCVMAPTWSGGGGSKMRPDEGGKKPDYSVDESFIAGC